MFCTNPQKDVFFVMYIKVFIVCLIAAVCVECSIRPKPRKTVVTKSVDFYSMNNGLSPHTPAEGLQRVKTQDLLKGPVFCFFFFHMYA